MEQGIELDESDLQLMEDLGEDFTTRKEPPQRVFCDICDLFDERDTTLMIVQCSQVARLKSHTIKEIGMKKGHVTTVRLSATGLITVMQPRPFDGCTIIGSQLILISSAVVVSYSI
eukprot:m.155814 g.155814  ORF g.155814 m.155814 type:complete len:116 (+) comp38679_c1_seq2:4690-5037(+)